MVKSPIKITDTTFRDAHQSLMATRLRTEDMEPIASAMDAVGFNSVEVWGGATFDAATRFLNEDPWERLRRFKRLMPRTPFSMLLRGQALVGYRAYADDIVDAFVQRSGELGIDIFRVFDALNDEWNLQRAADAVKRNNKHLQLTICYSVTEEEGLGGDIYTLEYYLDKARRFQDMGADSICLKDMAGLLAPYDAYRITIALKEVLNIPLQLHTHYTSGMASMTVLKAIEAGIDAVDTCLAPLALRTSQPAIEPLVMTLKGTDRDTGLNLHELIRIGDHFESILQKYRDLILNPRAAVIDAKVLSHQIPGGMASNLISQLVEAKALDRLDEVLEDIPKTRRDLGYPPLVTPLSQMIGSQSVNNVLLGKYKMISGPIKDYVYGLYGRPPGSIKPEIVDLVLKDSPHGKTPISERPANLIEPELGAAWKAINGISTDIGDALIYALYPNTGMKFLRTRHDPKVPLEEVKPDTSRSIEETREGMSDTTDPNQQSIKHRPPKSNRTRTFNVYVDDEFFQVEIDPVRPVQDVVRGSAEANYDMEPSQSPNPSSGNEEHIVAPMPGILIRYLVEVEQSVQVGDPVAVLEAMKMENTLTSPIDGTVKSLPVQSGETVATSQVLAIIAFKKI